MEQKQKEKEGKVEQNEFDDILAQGIPENLNLTAFRFQS